VGIPTTAAHSVSLGAYSAQLSYLTELFGRFRPAKRTLSGSKVRSTFSPEKHVVPPTLSRARGSKCSRWYPSARTVRLVLAGSHLFIEVRGETDPAGQGDSSSKGSGLTPSVNVERLVRAPVTLCLTVRRRVGSALVGGGTRLSECATAHTIGSS